MKVDLEKEKLYEDKFKTSSTKIDDLIVGQKPTTDKGGLGMEAGEISKDV